MRKAGGVNQFSEVRAKLRRRSVIIAMPVLGFMMALSALTGAILGVLFALLFAGYWAPLFLTNQDPVDVALAFRLILGFGAVGGIATVAIGLPVMLIAGDRIGPWVVGAEPANADIPEHARIIDAFHTVGLAAGAQPIVHIVDEPTVNVTALGRRGHQPVFVTFAGAARLDRRDLETLAALGLSDAVGGGGAIRFWQAARSIPALPVLAALRGWPVFAALWAGQFLVLALAVHPVAMIVPLGALLIAVPYGSVALLWGLLVYVLAVVAGSRFKANADVGAMALLRHPEQWWEAMIVFDQWPRAMSQRSAAALDWLVPTTSSDFRRRANRLQRVIPAVGTRLGGSPFPEHLAIDLWIGHPDAEPYRRLRPRWERAS